MPDAASGFQIIYADDSLLVLNKPAGLLSVPGRGADKQDCLSYRVQQRCPDALVVHRLDMATSGLMLMAREADMQRLLSSLFEQREIHKRYIAVVDGHMQGDELTNVENESEDSWQLVDLPIAVDWPNRPLRIIDANHGKPSQTRWRVISFDENTQTTRVELEPITGRSHQLRVHLKALGHPILGDALYAPVQVLAKADRLLLHATALEFIHPASRQAMSFMSRPPF